MRRAFIRGFLVLFFAIAAMLQSGGQTPYSLAPTISSVVIGPCEEAISHVKVTATREPKGQRYSAITDDQGVYRISGVAPGSYSVEFVRSGFRTEIKTGVPVSPFGATEVPMRLRLARGRVRSKDPRCLPFNGQVREFSTTVGHK